METKAWLRILARAACAACLVFAGAAAVAQPVAIVTDLQGHAALETEGVSKPLEILSELREGSRVRLEPGSRAVALYLKTGAQYQLGGPGQVEFPATGPAASGGATATPRPVEPGKQIRLGSGLTQGGIIVRSGGIRAVAPSATVLEESPEFVWYDLRHGVRYRFTLAEASGPVVYEIETDARRLRLPAGSSLRSGTRYRWSVTPLSGPTSSGGAVFQVAGDDLRTEANALRPGADAPFSDRVAYALWLEDVALRAEAVRLWRELAAARPADATLRSRAARGP